MSLEQIKYKWENNAISKEEMCKLVENNEIERIDFFNITRMYYDIVRKNIQEQKEKGYLF